MDLFRKKPKESITAIMDSDLEKLLIQTEQYVDFVNGKIKCECCGRIMSLDNLSIMLPQKQNERLVLRFWCDQMDCVSKFNDSYGK